MTLTFCKPIRPDIKTAFSVLKIIEIIFWTADQKFRMIESSF